MLDTILPGIETTLTPIWTTFQEVLASPQRDGAPPKRDQRKSAKLSNAVRSVGKGRRGSVGGYVFFYGQAVKY
jgi:hypothetical protein